MRRVLCLRLPRLSIERLPGVVGKPLADGVVVVAPRARGQEVVRCDAVVRRRGVRVGQTLAEACALAPQLTACEHDPAADRRALEALAAWADCLSPVVHIEGDTSLLVEVTGCARLFDGEENLIARAQDALSRRGYTVVAALADTPGAAWALAHAGGDEETAAISPVGGVAASLRGLPVWALRIEASAVERLRQVGVETIEALLHLPRSSLAKRFGAGVLHRLDQALGDAPELLDSFQTVPVVRAQVRFTGATDRLEVLREGLEHGLVPFCAQLERAVQGVRQVHVTFYGQRRTKRTLTVELARATRDRFRLAKLLDVRLDALQLTDKVEALCIWTRAVQRLDGTQQVWFETEAADARALGDLLERLAVRLGSAAVVRAHQVADHLPERAYAYAPAIETNRRRGGRVSEGPPDDVADVACRPLCLFTEPRAARVMALVPDGPPIRFAFDGIEHCVARWVGPERIETGWWRGRHQRRDYYRVESDTGCRYWLFRDRTREAWFVHGCFD